MNTDKQIMHYIKNMELDTREKLAMIYFAIMADGAEQCQVSIPQIASGIGASGSTAMRVCKRLAEKEYIQKIMTFKKDLGRDANIIKILK